MGAYGGGQYELGVGRGQIQYLAALFHPDAPNDIAPAGYDALDPEPGLPPSPARARARRHRVPPADLDCSACLRSSVRSGSNPSPRSARCRSSSRAATRSWRPRRSTAPRPRRCWAPARRSGWTPSARGSTSASRSPPRGRRSACSCGGWPRPRWRSPSAAPGDLKVAAEKLGQTPPSSRQLLLLRFMGIIAPPPGSNPLLRIRGVLLVILLIVAVLALGWGLVQLVALPFGGLDPAISVFWGLLLVLIVLGVLFFVGRRRQSAARAKAAEQRANALGHRPRGAPLARQGLNSHGRGRLRCRRHEGPPPVLEPGRGPRRRAARARPPRGRARPRRGRPAGRLPARAARLPAAAPRRPPARVALPRHHHGGDRRPPRPPARASGRRAARRGRRGLLRRRRLRGAHLTLARGRPRAAAPAVRRGPRLRGDRRPPRRAPPPPPASGSPPPSAPSERGTPHEPRSPNPCSSPSPPPPSARASPTPSSPACRPRSAACSSSTARAASCGSASRRSPRTHVLAEVAGRPRPARDRLRPRARPTSATRCRPTSRATRPSSPCRSTSSSSTPRSAGQVLETLHDTVGPRRGRHLRRARRALRPPARLPRRRDRLRPQPGPDRRALPPRPPGLRRDRQLRRRRRAQARAAHPRRRPLAHVSRNAASRRRSVPRLALPHVRNEEASVAITRSGSVVSCRQVTRRTR